MLRDRGSAGTPCEAALLDCLLALCTEASDEHTSLLPCMNVSESPHTYVACTLKTLHASDHCTIMGCLAWQLHVTSRPYCLVQISGPGWHFSGCWKEFVGTCIKLHMPMAHASAYFCSILYKLLLILAGQTKQKTKE